MQFDHVVVVGGGIAGLMATTVLAAHARAITVVERDRFPERAEPRKGVPQARHLHVFLSQGYAEAARLLPGLDSALDKAGAKRVDWARDSRLLSAYGWYPRYELGLASRFCSRSLLEQVIRGEVAGLSNVTFETGVEVIGLLPTESGVAGVSCRARGVATPEFELPANLVVDAAGRDSKLPQWLANLRLPAPDETVVDAHLGYATRLYDPPADFDPDWLYLLVRNPLPDTRAGAVAMIEDGRLLVTLGGFAGDYPPQDDRGFLRFAESLAVAEVAQLIMASRPITPVASFRRTQNRLRHLDRLPRWPSGLVAMGDAVCTFNPIYGQGMSLAIRGAVLLGRVLDAGRGTNFEREFQRRLARMIVDPWTLATGEDYRYPGTEGPPRPITVKLQQWYADQVLRAAVRDRRVHRAFVEVVHMVRRPASLARPGIMVRVAHSRLTDRHARSRAEAT